jgi:Protein of unknown function (DUF998)
VVNRIQLIASGAVAVAALIVLVGTIYFASLRPGYSHISNTISELAEIGAPHAGAVSFGFFLPVGLLVWLGLTLVFRQAPDEYVTLALIALSGLGAGYVIAAFFPCDPGGPIYGTWRTLIHNVAGIIDYEGTGLGFLFIADHFARQGARFKAAAFLFAGVLLLVCTGLFCFEALRFVRGAIQRIAEVVQFGGVFFVCYRFAPGPTGIVMPTSATNAQSAMSDMTRPG